MSLVDIIGPVMVGPSSSHTAGAARIGNLASLCFGKPVARADIYLRGSFADTAKGHGTDKAIVAGVLGMAPDDIRLKDSFRIADERGVAFNILSETVDGAHPNSARLVLSSSDGSSMSIVGTSIGGGAVILENIDGFDVKVSGELPTLVTFHDDVRGVVARVTSLIDKMGMNIATLSLSRKSKSGTASMIIEVDLPFPNGTAEMVLSSSPAIKRAFILPSKGDSLL